MLYQKDHLNGAYVSQCRVIMPRTSCLHLCSWCNKLRLIGCAAAIERLTVLEQLAVYSLLRFVSRNMLHENRKAVQCECLLLVFQGG